MNNFVRKHRAEMKQSIRIPIFFLLKKDSVLYYFSNLAASLTLRCSYQLQAYQNVLTAKMAQSHKLMSQVQA